MGEKDVARETDLESHIQSPPQTVHGIFAIVKTKIASMIAAALGALSYQGAAYNTSPFIQSGNASSTPVTFGVAFKGGTTPIIVAISVGYSKEIVNITGPSNTGFSFTIKYADGGGGGGTVNWIAIGERA